MQVKTQWACGWAALALVMGPFVDGRSHAHGQGQAESQKPAPLYPDYPSETPEKFTPPTHGMDHEAREVMVPMRDGVNLAADVYLPKTAAGRFPVILLRSPYNKDTYGGSTRPNLKSTAYRFAAGHRIRLHVANSNFPQYERNSSTGGNIFDEATYLRSSNAAHFGPRYPPALVLPVVPK